MEKKALSKHKLEQCTSALQMSMRLTILNGAKWRVVSVPGDVRLGEAIFYLTRADL